MIETFDLTVGYREPVLRALSLQFAPGKVHALLGPNGCGKTTLFKTLIGLQRPLSGMIQLDGKNLDSIPVNARAQRIAYVPQTQQHVFPYTALEMVLMGRTAHLGMFRVPSHHDHEHAMEALANFGIAALANQTFNTLSGGQRQLVIMARALAQGASIFVLDEPTASLDFGNELRVLDEIGRIADQGWTVVLSTHNPSHALQLAHQVVILKDGLVLDHGPAKTVMTEDNLSALYSTAIRIGVIDNVPVCLPKSGAFRSDR